VQAQRLDDFQRENDRLIGPLHGVPITVKDQFNISGLDSTMGYVGRAFSPVSSDAPLVKRLKQLGAVIMAKTNLPQSIMVKKTSEVCVPWLTDNISGARPITHSGV
jgi:amidase